MTSGGLLEADYSEIELTAAQKAAEKKNKKLHQKALDFIKRVCPFGK
ncbi:hypothetical protein ACKUB1_13780 [Methanospirillum stamsii]|nr:hypothetical protein [Methanospirillum stamsii]